MSSSTKPLQVKVACNTQDFQMQFYKIMHFYYYYDCLLLYELGYI